MPVLLAAALLLLQPAAPIRILFVGHSLSPVGKRPGVEAVLAEPVG